MNINKKFICRKIIVLLLYISCKNIISYELRLKWVKDKDWSLKQDFMQELNSLFSPKYFIETGTYNGWTIEKAASIFKNIYSIELSKKFYDDTKNRLSNLKNIELIFGDSCAVLPELLKNINNPVLFWLDGHYSSGGTAIGKGHTPVIEELKAIGDSKNQDNIILVDDVRLCLISDWPNLKQVFEKIKIIDPEQEFWVFGDIIISWPKKYTIKVSPVIEACTKSRFYDEKIQNYNDSEILEAEKIIGQASGSEKDAIIKLFELFNPYTPERGMYSYALWYGLILMHDKRYQEAINKFENAKILAPNKNTTWRIDQYLENCIKNSKISNS